MRFSLRRLNCRWLKPINGAGKIGRVRDLWYFSLSSLGLGLSLSGETIFSGKIGLGRNLWCCWEKLVAPEIFDIFSISSLGLGLDLSGKNLSPPKSLIFFPQQCSMSCCQQLSISKRVKINMTEEDVQCTLSTSRGLILKAFGRSTNKMETCVSFNWLQMCCLQAAGRGKRQLPRSQIGKVGDSPFYWTNILIFQSEHFKAKSLLFSANLGENSLIWKQFYSHIDANFKTFTGVDLSFWQIARILWRIYKFYIISAFPIGWESDHCFSFLSPSGDLGNWSGLR